MDGVIERTQARELVGNAVLWPRVRDFLWDFAPQIHPSWLADLRDVKSPRIKRFILGTLGVEPCFHAFPKDDGSRLVLLDGATLVEIAKWLGALALADELRRVTDGATVRALKAALPGVYPEVFGYTAYFGDSIPFRHRAETQSMDEMVVGTGHEIFMSALSSLPASLVSRLKLKLPKSLCDIAPLRETKDPALILKILFKLLKLKFPEAYSLCYS